MVRPVSSFSLSSMAMAVGMKSPLPGVRHLVATITQRIPYRETERTFFAVPCLPSGPPLLHRPCPRSWANDDPSILYARPPRVAHKVHFHSPGNPDEQDRVH